MVLNLHNRYRNSKSHLQLVDHHHNNNLASHLNNNLHNLNSLSKCSKGHSLGHKDHKVHNKPVNLGLVLHNKQVVQDPVDLSNNKYHSNK
jgi:hypothetical protein